LAAAQARVEQANVAVDTARLQLDRMTIRAPVDGRVFQLVSTPGARLSGGMGDNSTYDSSTVITMYRPSMLQVRADVRFEDLPRVSDGQPVLIENPALDAPLRGKVLLVSSLADIQKNTLEVKVAIDDPPGVFKPEMLVDVTFLAPAQATQPAVTHQELRLLVPESLIRRDGDAAFVWVADQSDGVAKRATVQLGAQAAGGLREITSGLDPASRLIASDSTDLVPGQRILVVGEMSGLAVSSANSGGRSDARPLNRLPSGGID
jgi:RND family efflux transporter MFP subunit